jgi:hypothetical protein
MASDPGWARAQRALLRAHDQERCAVATVLGAEEGGDQADEGVNEVGVVIEPFHLQREREVSSGQDAAERTGAWACLPNTPGVVHAYHSAHALAARGACGCAPRLLFKRPTVVVPPPPPYPGGLL